MEFSSDRWIDIAIRAVAVLIVATIVAVGVLYFSQQSTKKAASPAEMAAANLERVVRKNPQSALARLKFAESLAAAGRVDDAQEQLLAALTIEKDYPPALMGLAKIAMFRKEWKTAEAYWKKVVESVSDLAQPQRNTVLDEAYYGLGVTYLESKRYEEAVREFKNSLSVRKDASDTHYMLSVAYRELDLTDMQRKELGITLAFDPNHAQANYDLGLLALKDKDEGLAAELFRISADNVKTTDLPDRELEKLADEASVKVRLARATDPATPLARALSDARVAAALEPKDLAAIKLVARLWERSKDPARALNAWQRALELAPKDIEAAAAVKRLGAIRGK